MKQANRKKGFSLIELIVVIAVIAAIAAVIVPSISNFNDEARATSDERNVQLWNQTYLEAKAAGATGLPTAVTGKTVPAISTNVNVGNTPVSFVAPTFTVTGNVNFVANGNPPLTYSR
ncbi:MAG: prepilin-type N-terminal cleavage/methylation domain-containing protein [Opitutales bacterium]|nr:prepilin-type N-terminal cleavage/methylation domain-containing protein [Opitutales bacterium]